MGRRCFPFAGLRGLALAAVLLGATPAVAQECGPSFNPRGPDAEAYGAAQDYPLARIALARTQPYMVGSFSHFDRLRPGPTVSTSATPSSLARDCTEFVFHYEFDGRTLSLDDYLARNPTTGLLIAKGSDKGATILVERYQYGRRDTDRFTSQSMAKTITSMLFGIALNEGKIRSLDDRAEDYVPALKGSAYGGTTLRSLLTMSSGVAYTETYDGTDDASKFGRDLFRPGTPGASILLRRYDNREVPEGTRFHYAGSETETLGLVLAAATGQSLPSYASEKLWQPMGAEADAVWSVDTEGQALAFCCFNARLRDYARLGLLLADNGGGVIPEKWVIEATTAPRDSFRAPRKATPFDGYGYQTWILPFRKRMFALRGIHGQAIFVYPAQKLVLVHTAVRLKPSMDPSTRELSMLWYALVRHFDPPPANDAQAPRPASSQQQQ
jgi:CubicO group peptidase (beta-lactamase class C family)